MKIIDKSSLHFHSEILKCCPENRRRTVEIEGRHRQEIREEYCIIVMFYLDRLLAHLPSLQHLTVRLFTDLQNSTRLLLHSRQDSLRHLNLTSLAINTINNIAFDHVIDLFRHSFHHLKKFTFFFKTDAASHACLDYLDENRWQTLLQGFISLIEFRCCIELPIEPSTIVDHYVRQFNENVFFRLRPWKFVVDTYTYSYNRVLRLHTQPYPKRRLDIV
jgi:hypothetical protein